MGGQKNLPPNTLWPTLIRTLVLIKLVLQVINISNMVDSPDKQYNVKMRVWCVTEYIKSYAIEEIRGRFLHEFKVTNAPDKKSIYRWVENFRNHGTVEKKKHLNRKKAARVTPAASDSEMTA